MKQRSSWEPLPHEIWFGLMLLVWAGVGFFTGYGSFYGTLLILNIAAIWLTRVGKVRLGLLFYPVAMNLVFFNLKGTVAPLHPLIMDGFLRHMDSLLIGRNLSLRLQPYVHPALTEFFSICYILFFPWLFFSIVRNFFGDLRLLEKFVIGLFTIYGIGFIGYCCVPAAGPYVAMAGEFTVPLQGWWFTRWNAAIVQSGSNGIDVFPSLHCAVSSFLLFFDWRHRRWRFWIYLLPCAGLWFSTIYLRYHYLVDLLCGLALGAFGLWLSRRYPRETGS